MIKEYKSLVVGGKSCGMEDVFSPWDGQLVGRVPIADGAIADTAIQTAYEIHQNRRWLDKARRVEIISKAKQILESRVDELALQAATEGGKPLVDSKIELLRAVDGLQICIECVRTHHGEEIPMGITASSMHRLATTHHEPIGVVLAFSAFNHPMNLIVHQIGPAIAAGCPVIVKPAKVTPLSCFALVEIFHEAGLPLEYCQALLVNDHKDLQKMISDPRIDFFSFIGSAKVGWMLRSQLAPGTRCALEHGGAAPVILTEDADLDDAVPLLAKGAFYHAGQVCISVQRIYAHHSISQKFCEKLAAQANNMVVGDPTSPTTDVGPLIKKQELKRVEDWVAEAIEGGAELICGAKRLSESSYACTVLLNPPPDAKVSCHEIFGPVVCVYTYTDINDAIQSANALPLSFQASVFSRNIDTAMYCCRQLNAAAVMVNDHTAFRVDWMPFAGYKHSGYGTGGIRYTFEDMQIDKMIVLRSTQL